MRIKNNYNNELKIIIKISTLHRKQEIKIFF